ncbi:alpha-2B adrenergic receptor [Tachyglossus aculeatus]|uniref:alpha-2B adrenergic receptor n=1 Tax=Tachyglossus aculeatus TaxID=9261 RepID=UPI0018F72A72|nr:alpha-2B adrenergic receptor [Tachyglossus aculeatus]
MVPAPYSVQATAAIAAVITFLILFTLFGNTLVIAAVLTSRSLRAPQNLFLVSLAAADILVATLIIPFSLANELLGYWYFRPTWCRAYLALDVLFCTSSIVHLCAISLDRYWAVSRALEYPSRRTPRRVKAAILAVWLLAAFISLPPLIYKGDPGPRGPGRPQCRLNDEAWYVLASSIGSFFAPCLIMILVYLRIYLIAKRRTRPGPRISGPADPAALQPNGLPVVLEDGEAVQQPPTSQAPGPPPTRTSPLSPAAGGQEGGGHHPSLTPGVKEEEEEEGEEEDEEEEEGPGMGGKEGEEEDREEGRPPGQPASFSSSLPPRGAPTLATGRGRVLLARGAASQRGRPPWRRRTQLNREKRFTFVLAVVIGVFVLCWFPFFFSYSLGAVCPQRCKLPHGLFQFFFWIGYCNSSLNPVIYTVFNQDFRKAFRRILCRQPTRTAW